MNNKENLNKKNDVDNVISDDFEWVGGISAGVNNLVIQPNSYWRPPLQPHEIKEKHDRISWDFLEHFSLQWYLEEPQVWINDGIDDSVYFVGAPISVLKPYLVNWVIPNEWIGMSQDCIRTRNTKSLLDDEKINKWGSCFTWIATLVNTDKGLSLLKDSIEYLLETLQIPLKNIRINIAEKDTDLINMLDAIDCEIECVYNSEPDVYYTHKYGLWETVWRNFNFVLREEWTENFHDIWNFIIIENDQNKKWYELALWVSVIMKWLYWLDHTMQASPIEGLLPYKIYWDKFQDSIVSAVTLVRLGILPKASNSKGRILRTYLRGILYFAEKNNFDFERIKSLIDSYEWLEFSENSWASTFIHKFLLAEKERLMTKKKDFSNEEDKLMWVLKKD